MFQVQHEEESPPPGITTTPGAHRRSPSCCYSGGDEICSSPIPQEAPYLSPVITRQDSKPEGIKNDKCVRQHFFVVLKAITACVVEFVLFAVLWGTVYVLTAVLGVRCQVNVVMVILLHTTVTSVLYSASYTKFSKKAVKARARAALLK